jgi:predicted DNA-binding transcriptional regulator AlpA
LILKLPIAANDNEKLPTRRTANRVSLSEMRPIPRRGLSRVEAAMYIGISVSKFDQLVRDGRMPPPIVLDNRKLWDIRKLDVAFEALDAEPIDQSWDDFADSLVKAA